MIYSWTIIPVLSHWKFDWSTFCLQVKTTKICPYSCFCWTRENKLSHGIPRLVTYNLELPLYLSFIYRRCFLFLYTPIVCWTAWIKSDFPLLKPGKTVWNDLRKKLYNLPHNLHWKCCIISHFSASYQKPCVKGQVLLSSLGVSKFLGTLSHSLRENISHVATAAAAVAADTPEPVFDRMQVFVVFLASCRTHVFHLAII